MITEKVTDNQTITVSDSTMGAYHPMGDSVYSAESASCSQAYREHLDRALHNECVAVPEEEYEDLRRYSERSVNVEAEEAEANAATVVPTADKKPDFQEKETVRVFNQKRAIWLAVYILLALGVVLALLFTLPGTAWERKSITVSEAELYPTAVADELPQSVMANNTIYTLEGTAIEVELEPYVEKKPATNWFDTLCDWLNNAIGG